MSSVKLLQLDVKIRDLLIWENADWGFKPSCNREFCVVCTANEYLDKFVHLCFTVTVL